MKPIPRIKCAVFVRRGALLAEQRHTGGAHRIDGRRMRRRLRYFIFGARGVDANRDGILRALCVTLLVGLPGGCVSARPEPRTPRPMPIFRSADGRVAITVLGTLSHLPARPDARTRLDWFLYGPDDEGGSALRRPQGIAVSPDALFIADQGRRDLLRFDLKTRRFGSWIRPADRPDCPVAVSTDPDGNVYVVDASTRSVLKYDNRGGRQTVTMPNSISSNAGAFRPSAVLWHGGILYVADAGLQRVHRWDTTAQNWLAPLGPQLGDQTLTLPAGMAMADSGVLLVADALLGVVHRVDSNSGPLPVLGEYGGEDGQLIRPNAVACSASGLVFVSDAGRESLVVFDRNGHFLVEVAGIPGTWDGLLAPAGVVVTPQPMIQPQSTPQPPEADEGIPEFVLVSDLLRGEVTILRIDQLQGSTISDQGSASR